MCTYILYIIYHKCRQVLRLQHEIHHLLYTQFTVGYHAYVLGWGYDAEPPQNGAFLSTPLLIS